MKRLPPTYKQFLLEIAVSKFRQEIESDDLSNAEKVEKYDELMTKMNSGMTEMLVYGLVLGFVLGIAVCGFVLDKI